MNDIRIYIAFHRSGEKLSKDNIYKRLLVGKHANRLNSDMLHDAGGDNISHKNNWYSELTGWYWIWKNCRHDIVGTSHYRRYFTTSIPSLVRLYSKKLLFLIGLKKKRHGLFYVRNVSRWEERILSRNEIESLLEHNDLILPQKKQFKYSVYEQYKRRHNVKDIEITREIIKEKYPEFEKSFDEVFQSKKMYAFNMFITRWEIFDEYMKWLFSILFELEKRVEINFNDKYQKRVCAFMAERLQTVWIHNKNLTVKELPIIYFKKKKKKHF